MRDLFSWHLAVSFPDLTHVCSLMWISGSLSLSYIFPLIPLFLFISIWEWVLLMWQEFGRTLRALSALPPTDFSPLHLSIHPSLLSFSSTHLPFSSPLACSSTPCKEGCVCGLRQPWLQLQFISINLIWVFCGTVLMLCVSLVSSALVFLFAL